MDIYSELADSVLAIKSDPDLKTAFIKILKVGAYTQQIRVEKISKELSHRELPPEVAHLLALLKDDKLAGVVYSELIK